MGIDSQDQTVVDPNAFIQLSAIERVRQVLLMSGRTPKQIKELTLPQSLITAVVNNLLTCRGHENAICACTQDRLVTELTKYPPGEVAPWSNLDTCLHLMAVAKPMSDIPTNVAEELIRRWDAVEAESA